MEIILEKAIENDAAALFQMQLDSFTPLLNKYRDYATNPANESIEKTIIRINNPSNNYYKMIIDSNLVGAICISKKEIPNKFWISPMFIHPIYQGKGIAQRVLILIEEMFPKAQSFELATILEEERNCFLYEKMGYTRTGVIKKLNDKTTLVYYKKER
ncbi:N-acetyltransferase [Bacillus cereus]|uniref:GNAT family N-acetyltransferase n=1 Tax=Bacillus cereus TaxID=1396 RepID=UPI0011A8166B|nr:GNAT family N-acetyltransferase [Bacillus cereus]